MKFELSQVATRSAVIEFAKDIVRTMVVHSVAIAAIASFVCTAWFLQFHSSLPKKSLSTAIQKGPHPYEK